MDRLHFEIFILFLVCASIRSALGFYTPIQSPALFSRLDVSLSSFDPAVKGTHLAGSVDIQGRAATRTHKIAAATPKPAAQTIKPAAALPTLKPESLTTHSQLQPTINTAPAESQSAAAKGLDSTTSTATNGGPVPIVPVQENAESDGESTSRTVRIIMGLVVLNLAIGVILCGIGVYVCVKRRKDGEREMEGGAAYAQVENTKAGETVFDAKYESHEEQA